MNVISYAQNFEDVMLWRALKDVQNGFYVDVGANDPVVDSVTRWFYLQGWHGVNIEPVPFWHKRLQDDRPRDINLQVAVSTATGRLTLYDVPDTGLSTLSSQVAEAHVRSGAKVTEITVPTAPLDSLLAQHVEEQEIHFLKIDVEGAERDVLESTALQRFRPWIILVEATEPRHPVTNHQLWEDLITGRGYQFAYFDGLNRFYVAAEKAELAASLQTPPNTFDTFMRYAEWQARTECQQQQQRIKQQHEELAQLHATVQEVRGEIGQLQDERRQLLNEHGKLHQEHHLLLNEHGKLHQEHHLLLNEHGTLQQEHRKVNQDRMACLGRLRDMEQSTSWRITSPLRQVLAILGRGPAQTVRSNLELQVELSPIGRPVGATDVLSPEPPPPESGVTVTSQQVPTTSELLFHQVSVQWRLIDQMEQQFGVPAEISCALCGHAAATTEFTAFDAQCRFGGGRLLRYQCPRCDVIFGPFKMLRLNAEELDQEYQWHYRIYSEGDSTEQEIRAFKALSPKPGGTYLNYGAGAWSSSVQHLRTQGWNIVAYEPTGSAQAQPGLVTQREVLADMRFDGIYSNNVLEHLRHPVQDMRFLASLLRPGARMSHATPCFEYLYEYTRFHLYFYLGHSRQLLADQAGLRICGFEQDGLYMNTVYEPLEIHAT